ncbi:MAG: branched-chain amino acid ABC transporter substrate-binding protein [Candidatus Nanopelagicales bacterium]
MATRTRVAAAALAAVGLAAAALAPIPAVAGDKGTIVIALEAPLTGSQASNGKDMLRGAQLAAMQVNARGGVLGRTIKIVGVDDKADPALGAQAVQEAKAAGAVAVIGPYNSSVGLVNLSLYEEAGIVPLRMTSDNRTEGYGATLQPMNSQISPVEVDYISGLGIDSVAMLVDPSAYTKSIASRTAKGLEKAGIKVTQIVIPASASDYSAEVGEALATGPDMVYSATYFPEGVLIAEELAQANTTATCFMNLANVDDAFVEEAGIATSRTCTFSGVPAAPQLPYAGDYVTAYRAEFDVNPDVWGAFTYDSAWVLFHAMAQTGTTKYAPLLDAVLHTRGLQGATGPIDIRSKSGNREDVPMYILKVNRKGDFVIVE